MKKWRHHISLALFCLGFTYNPIAANTFSTLAAGLLAFSSIVSGQGLSSFSRFSPNISAGHGGCMLSPDIHVQVGGMYFEDSGYDIVIKIRNTTSGDLIGDKKLGFLMGNETGYGVIPTHDGGYTILAVTDWPGAGPGINTLEIKILNDQVAFGYAIGGSGDDIGTSIKPNPDNNGFLMTINTNSFSLNTYYDGMVVSTDSNGQWVWNAATDGEYNELLHGIDIDSNNEAHVVGSTQTYAIENGDGFRMGINTTTGNKTYVRGYQRFDEAFHDITIKDNGKSAVVGYSFHPETGWVELLMTFDDTHRKDKAVSYGRGNIDYANAVEATSIGYIATGGSPQEGGHNYDLSLTEFDENAQIEFYKIAGNSTDENKGTSVTVDGNEDFMVGGIRTTAEGNNLATHKFKGTGLEDCGTTTIPPSYDISFEFQEYDINLTLKYPTLTFTDIVSNLIFENIVSAVEVEVCTQV